MKIRALKKFEGIKDKERDVYPKEGDVWEVTEERAKFLKTHGVIEYVKEETKINLKKKPTKKKKNKKEE